MATISIEIDDDVKRDVEKEFKALGLTMSSGISIYLHKVRNEHRVPFELNSLKNAPKYNIPISIVEKNDNNHCRENAELSENDIVKILTRYNEGIKKTRNRN